MNSLTAAPALSSAGPGSKSAKGRENITSASTGLARTNSRNTSITLLIIVLAARAVSRRTEDATGRSIRKFVRTARRYRIIEIQATAHVITAAGPGRATSIKPPAAPTAIPVRTN